MSNKTDTDRLAVLAVIEAVYVAWEANDADEFVDVYLNDATVVQPGIYKKDRQEIRTTMAAGFGGPLKGSRVTDTPQDVRFVNDETAIVVSQGGILFPGETTCPSDRMVRATWVLAKRDDDWFVAAYHNSPLN
ncbi:MAG: SgcJ/EcaC family oxidoreductase [Acidimicrobiales bacterium]|jgi:uncharacterized protein (TIGR02246 family)